MAAALSFGRYRVTKPLGVGGMGEVYEAVDDVLGREVAIKTLKTSSGITARLLDDRFRQEARAIAQLSHPGVVQVFDIDLAAEPPYLVMERVAGPSLDDRLEQGPLTVADAIPLGIQIARALAAAHAAKIVHRDVKPANILGAGKGVWKLADFGVAHVPDSSLTITGQFVGSPAYAPPEALLKGVSAPSGDIYGLGATLYEALAGRWPRLEAKGALLAPVPPLAQIAPHVPERLAAAIDRAVAFEPADRPSADELADLLAHATIDPAAIAIATPAPGQLAMPTPVPGRIATPMPGGLSVPGAAAVSLPGGSMSSSQFGSQIASSPGASSPGVAAAHVPWHQRWQTWALGALALLVIIVIAVGRDGGGGRSSARTSVPTHADDSAGTPQQIDATPPANMDGKTARDWNRIVDELWRQNYRGARHRLDDWERKHGECEESQHLREQIDALPPELLDRGRD